LELSFVVALEQLQKTYLFARFGDRGDDKLDSSVEILLFHELANSDFNAAFRVSWEFIYPLQLPPEKIILFSKASF